jgi:hypothetical protein
MWSASSFDGAGDRFRLFVQPAAKRATDAAMLSQAPCTWPTRRAASTGKQRAWPEEMYFYPDPDKMAMHIAKANTYRSEKQGSEMTGTAI